MKKLSLQISLLLGLCLITNQMQAQYTPAMLFNDLQNELNTAINTVPPTSNLQGAAISVMLRDGSTWTGTSGNQCVGAVDPVKQWHWGSISKATTATIIMQMRDQGLLSLDDSLGTYFDPSLFSDSIDATNNTIRDLLQHTSDIYDPWIPEDPGANPPFPGSPFYQFVKNNPCSLLTQASGFSYVNSTDPNPNRVHKYKPYINYALLSMVIESISGNSLKQEYQNRLFTPLGMTNSTLVDSSYDVANMNGLFANAQPRCANCHDAYFTRGGGGALLSSAADITKFMNYLHSDSILIDSTMMEMRTVIDANISSPNPSSCGGDINVNYGLGVLQPNLIFAPGDTMKLYGHSGSGRSTGSVFHNIDSGWTVSIVSNDYGQLGQTTNLLIFDILCFLRNNPVDYPAPVLIPVADFGYAIANDSVVTFSDSTINNPDTWLWDFGDGNTSADQNPVHTYSSSGTYTVTLIASNSAGSDTIDASVTIQLPVGFSNYEKGELKVFPNPFDYVMNFDFRKLNDNPQFITIYNIHGVEVAKLENTSSEKSLQWNASEQKSGIYFYRVFHNDKVYQGRIIKN